ncbi:hypothetical protein ACX35G_000976 [Enterococcus faecalis]|uniref:hypothetical protein n=1 Tax=Enterococcus faecalis TaxID=1351 RepID=UPI00289265F9|nr:hypothetical protein [Enterococcus faecalis]MDT2165442.1 hypothetical protein [Enterococcus faecalis]
MFYYRISKYNPKYRDESGHYTLQDWTSFYDIGKVFLGRKLTVEEYNTIENLYIEVVVLSMKETKQEFLTVKALEKIAEENMAEMDSDCQAFYQNIHDGDKLSLEEIPVFMKLQLRELLWAKLSSKNLNVHFGYDYYMYIISSKKLSSVVESFYKRGIYIEENIHSPYEDF